MWDEFLQAQLQNSLSDRWLLACEKSVNIALCISKISKSTVPHVSFGNSLELGRMNLPKYHVYLQKAKHKVLGI